MLSLNKWIQFIIDPIASWENKLFSGIKNLNNKNSIWQSLQTPLQKSETYLRNWCLIASLCHRHACCIHSWGRSREWVLLQKLTLTRRLANSWLLHTWRKSHLLEKKELISYTFVVFYKNIYLTAKMVARYLDIRYNIESLMWLSKDRNYDICQPSKGILIADCDFNLFLVSGKQQPETPLKLSFQRRKLYVFLIKSPRLTTDQTHLLLHCKIRSQSAYRPQE